MFISKFEFEILKTANEITKIQRTAQKVVPYRQIQFFIFCGISSIKFFIKQFLIKNVYHRQSSLLTKHFMWL